MTHASRFRYEAAMVVIAPAVLAVGLAYHPYLQVLLDERVVAGAVAADTTRWGIAHMIVAVGSGLLLLAFIAIGSYLREAGDDVSSGWGLPFVALGSVLFAVLPGMEFAPLVAAEVGGDVQAAQAALQPWFIPAVGIGATVFAIGIYGFARGIARTGVLNQRITWLVIPALAVTAISRFVPLGAVQFYIQGAAGIIALWPLAYAMWRRPAPLTR